MTDFLNGAITSILVIVISTIILIGYYFLVGPFESVESLKNHVENILLIIGFLIILLTMAGYTKMQFSVHSNITKKRVITTGAIGILLIVTAPFSSSLIASYLI